jgi:serine/threonine-protein kinase
MKNNGDIVQFLKQKDYIMINNKLGSGSFGKTVILQDPFIDELFVAKKYAPVDDSIKVEFYKNFIDEIKILYKLNHKNIVRIHGYYPYENNYSGYIIMEYIDGETIVEYLGNYIPFDPLPLNSIFSQLIDAFCYLESKNIIHRDIRPSNIMVDKDGTVKIIDFGIGKICVSASASDSIASQINRNNANTLPDEYYRSEYTSLTDMFYLGDLFRSILNDDKIIADIDFSYRKVINKMADKNPKNRYKNFKEIKALIDKHDFQQLEITETDKEIYKNFANKAFELITKVETNTKFQQNPYVFKDKLKDILNNNLFEDNVQNVGDLATTLFDGKIYFIPNKSIPCSIIKKFLNWFDNLSEGTQRIVLSNLESKLNQIPRYTSEDSVDIDEIPF